MHQDIKIQVSFDMKQSILGCCSTILHPLTEIKGLKFCSNGLQAKSVDRSGNISSDKTLEKQLEGQMHLDIKIQVSCDKKQGTLGCSSTGSIFKK